MQIKAGGIPFVKIKDKVHVCLFVSNNAEWGGPDPQLPNGGVDTGEKVIVAAMREAHEEISLPPAQTQILGSLMPYETGTGFRVTPVVALLQPSVTLVPNPLEVTDIFHVPLDFLMNPANHRRHALEWEGAMREWYSMPYRDSTPGGVRERFIWGATAGMLRNFYRLLIA